LKKIVLIGIVLVAVVALVAVAVIMSGDDESSGSNTGKIGNTLTVGNISVTVTSVEDRSSVGSYPLNVTADGNFILVHVTIKNNSSSEVTLTSSAFKLQRGSSTYNPHSSAGVYVTNGFAVIETIGSGITKNLVIVFETPTEHTADDYVFKITNSSKTASFALS
jgi:hypothetical protein